MKITKEEFVAEYQRRRKARKRLIEKETNSAITGRRVKGHYMYVMKYGSR